MPKIRCRRCEKLDTTYNDSYACIFHLCNTCADADIERLQKENIERLQKEKIEQGVD